MVRGYDVAALNREGSLERAMSRTSWRMEVYREMVRMGGSRCRDEELLTSIDASLKDGLEI